MNRGELTLFVGNMFANKTGSLMHYVETIRQFANKKVLILKPKTDTRSGTKHIKNFHGKSLTAYEIPIETPFNAIKIILKEEKMLGKKLDAIAFDEIQFFPIKSKFFNLVAELLNQGYDVIAAGLMLDFRGEPFGSTPLL